MRAFDKSACLHPVITKIGNHPEKSSFTYTQAAVLFDAYGKIVDLEVDALEVSMPKGTAPTSEEDIASDVNNWCLLCKVYS